MAGTGTLIAQGGQVVEAQARGAGRITALAVHPGMAVEPGSPIATVVAADRDQRLAGARALVDARRANVQRVRATIDQFDVFDLSIISPAKSRVIVRRLDDLSTTMLEGPVSGGMVRAKDGTIVIVVDGGLLPFDRQPSPQTYLRGWGTHVGAIRMGSIGQLINFVPAVRKSDTAEVHYQVTRRY